MKIPITTLAGALVFGFLGMMQPAFAQSNEYHGADSIFKANGIIVVWAIEKRGNDVSPLVYLRIVRTPSSEGTFRYFTVLAVDPFSKASRTLVDGQPLHDQNTVTAELAAFQEYSARRILLYATDEELRAETPSMVVFYQGVPDTSPEFLSVQKLEAYFSDTVQRIENR